MTVELISKVSRRITVLAKFRANSAEALRCRKFLIEGILIKINGNLFGDVVADGPERRDDRSRSGIQKRLGKALHLAQE